jgi:hypothetical protein
MHAAPASRAHAGRSGRALLRTRPTPKTAPPSRASRGWRERSCGAPARAHQPRRLSQSAGSWARVLAKLQAQDLHLQASTHVGACCIPWPCPRLRACRHKQARSSSASAVRPHRVAEQQVGLGAAEVGGAVHLRPAPATSCAEGPARWGRMQPAAAPHHSGPCSRTGRRQAAASPGPAGPHLHCERRVFPA